MTRAAWVLSWVSMLVGGCTLAAVTGEQTKAEAALPVQEATVEPAKPAEASKAAAPSIAAPEPARTPAPAPEPAPVVSPPGAEPAALDPFFASYPEQALAEPRYVARKPPKRAGEVQGLLPLRALLGQAVLASARPTAEVIGTLEPAGITLTTPSEVCSWVLFQPEIAWTKGKLRCGDVFLREPVDGEPTDYLVPVLETVTIEGTRFARIIATPAGRTGWVRAERVPLRFTKVLAKYATGGSPTWDRMLYAEPGVSPVAIEFRGAIALRIGETRKVDGRTWLRVEARVDQCIENSRRKLGEGWLPLHAEDGALNVYYEISC